MNLVPKVVGIIINTVAIPNVERPTRAQWKSSGTYSVVQIVVSSSFGFKKYFVVSIRRPMGESSDL